jgi:hypothetical protein
MTNQLKRNLFLGGAAILLLSIPFTILFCQNRKLRKQLEQLNGVEDIPYKKLTDSLQRAETVIADNAGALDEFAAEHGHDIETIRDDLQSIGAELRAISTTEAGTSTVVYNHYKSEISTPTETEVPTCENDGRPIDLHGYTKTIETKQLSDSNGMRVADVSFSAAEERPWSSKVHGIRYKILNTVGEGEQGQVILHTELTAENPTIQPGQIFRIKGIDSRTLQAPPSPPEFKWWDPAIYLMGQLSVDAYPEVGFGASLSLGFSPFSYGDWRFLGITAGYNAFQNTFRASLAPALYNIGEPLPFLSDTWLFFDVGIDTAGSVSVGLGIGTTL